MKLWRGLVAALGMLVLILDGQTALAGAQQGIDLCLKTVIPSLFPFFLLSTLLTSAFSGRSIPLLRPLGNLCGIPEGTEAILLTGFLGGYPVGAQCIASAYSSGSLSKSNASRMLAFCNNAGPAFLFGMAASAFPGKWYPVLLWAIHIASAVCTAVILPTPPDREAMVPKQAAPLSFPMALQTAIRTMGTVCGWVVLFRVLIAFAGRWFLWIFPLEVRVLLTGLLELSNGCWELLSIDSLHTRFLICSAILAFGGLCVTMQTVSVAGMLSFSLYVRGKLMQVFFSLLLSWGVLHRTWLYCFATLVISMSILRKMQKSSSNPAPVVV